MNFYNDIDPYVCEWTRNLIAAGHLPAGNVVCKPIEEIDPKELEPYVQCHFFNGISGWPLALRMADWPEDRRVFTGSCPCQPISSAGQRKGHADRRHLWPAFQRLIAECRPPVVFGEQVASKDGLEWLSGVRADMEQCGYAVGCADLAAAGVAAPHVRQRAYWVAHTCSVNGKARVGVHNESIDVEPLRRENHQKVHGVRMEAPSPADCMADEVPRYVDIVGSFGNAIVPPLAAEFIRAYMETAPNGDRADPLQPLGA